VISRPAGRARAVLVVTLAVLLVAAGCSGSDGDDATAPSSGAHGHLGPPVFGGQFPVAEALAGSALPRREARAVTRLAAGAAPTAAEVARVLNAMTADGPVAEVVPPPGDARARLDAELAAARKVVDRLPDARAARDAGYVLASLALPGIGAHWVKWSRVDQPFDPARPAMLLTDGNGPDAPVVGLSYFVRSPEAPSGFRGAGAPWHQHAGLCIVRGRLVAESVTSRDECAGGDGQLLPGRDLWMLHAWVVPDRVNPWGTFAPLNPALCPNRASCFPEEK
jgi:hypothetical protein